MGHPPLIFFSLFFFLVLSSIFLQAAFPVLDCPANLIIFPPHLHFILFMHTRAIVALVFGIIIIWVVLLDAFETVVLPRRVTRHFRLTAWFYRRTWIPWRKIAGRIQTASVRQNFLGYFGPLSLILLLGFWASGLIFGFALVQYGIGGHEQLGGERITFGKIVYHSGETFFTLGYGDIVPITAQARSLSILEAVSGMMYMAVLIARLVALQAAAKYESRPQFGPQATATPLEGRLHVGVD